MTVEILDDAEQVAARAAELFAAASTRGAGTFRAALAGGSTPKATYRRLAGPLRDRVDWSRVELYFGDERCVPPDHADSNYRMAREALLDHVPLPPGHVHRMRGEDPPEAAAAAYEALLPPCLDFVFLGMGADGHTASLFPGTSALGAPPGARCVATYVGKLGAFRITLTAEYLIAARELVVLVAGAEKAGALRDALRAPDGTVPITLLRPAAGRLRWLVDRAAAAQLT